MASRTGSERGAVVAQSAYPLFVASLAVSGAAAVLPLPPFSRDLMPNGQPWVGEVGQLFIIQSSKDLNVRFVGSGTTAASGTVTYVNGAGGARTIVLNGWTVSFTATGVKADDAALCATTINADPLLTQFFQASTNGVDVCTVRYKIPGAGGNLITFTGTGADQTLSGAGFLTSGVGPAAATSAVNSYFIAANQPAFVYRLAHHTQMDVLASGAGTLQLFYGV